MTSLKLCLYEFKSIVFFECCSLGNKFFSLASLWTFVIPLEILAGIKGHSNFFELLNKLIHFANLLIKFVFGQAIALNLNKSYQKGAVGGCPEPVN
jgi:hypothetical protein